MRKKFHTESDLPKDFASGETLDAFSFVLLAEPINLEKVSLIFAMRPDLFLITTTEAQITWESIELEVMNLLSKGGLSGSWLEQILKILEEHGESNLLKYLRADLENYLNRLLAITFITASESIVSMLMATEPHNDFNHSVYDEEIEKLQRQESDGKDAKLMMKEQALLFAKRLLALS